MNRLLIANRGEIAVRIIATAQDLGITCISVYPEDDALAQHVRLADDHYCLPGAGASANAGADVLVAGSAVFRGGSVSNSTPYGENIRNIRTAAVSVAV